MVNGSLSPGFIGKRRAGQDERDFVARLEILRAANDLAFARAVVDLAERKFVRTRMLVARDDLRHDDAVERAGNLLHALDFEAEHGEPLDRLLDGPIEINVLLEPVQGDFHRQKTEAKHRRDPARLPSQFSLS
jgi:hypothetical protein